MTRTCPRPGAIALPVGIALPLGIALALATAPGSAAAQSAKPAVIRVGTIVAAQECTVYQGVKYSNTSRASGSSQAYAAGSGSGYAGPYGGGGSASFSAGGSSSYSASSKTSFETFFLRDCKSNFEGIREAMQAALASSGTVVVGPGGYVLSGRVEDVVTTGSGFVDRSSTRRNYGSVSEGLRVTMSVNVADRNGRVVFGAPIATQIETGSASAVRGTVSADISSGEGVYGLLQREVALAAARKVAFHFRPLLVVQGGGQKVQLNYGAPLVEVGTMISVTSADGSSAARYRITSTSEGSALAAQVGDANSTAIGPGSRATVIEQGDPAANQSLMERVELP